MRRRDPVQLGRFVLVAALILSAACGSPKAPGEFSAGSTESLRPIALPDLSRVVPSVQKQIRDSHAALMLKADSGRTPPLELSEAYGETGKLLMAAEYADAAESSFVNAQALNPSDFRWPYYLGHLSRKKGDLAGAAPRFERAIQLQPDDVATLIWLGDVALAQGQPDAAEPRFQRALSLQPSSLSARFGLGRAALARQDYKRAATYLEEVLARDPSAAGAHYPLAMAYTGLGETKKAEEHLRQRREHEILPADPLMVELEGLLQSPQTYEKLGLQALDRRDWPAAVAEFRKGLEIDPSSAALRHRLGTALAMMGDDQAARAAFEEVVRISPGYARAQYSLGVIAAAEGRHGEAIQRFSTALQSEPEYEEARIALGASLRKSGRAGDALAQYEQVMKEQPQLSEAAFGYAMTLVQLKRFQAARDRLIDGRSRFHDDPRFVHALARLLAAAPDARVRDGAKAIEIVDELLRHEQRTIELGETLAMALAAVDRFDEASALQRQLIAGAEKGGLKSVVSRLAGNLQLYERREPCRTPWAVDELP